MSILILTYFLLMSIIQVNGNPKVSAAYIFGDSTVDSGNNNWINTITRANFPPYGRDFPGGKPTGRFTNGKLATDIASELLGLPDIIPAYLDPNFKGERLLTGACFASAASGFFYATPQKTNALDMNKQLELFFQYKAKLINMVGFENATKIISGAIFLMSAGTVDFTNYYFINPFARIKYTINTFQDIMLETFANFTRAIYHGGARFFLVMGLPPIGCLPSQITLHNLFGNKCVTRMNQASMSMNWKLQVMRVRLMKGLHGLNMVYLDSYNVILDILRKPSKYGFKHRRRGCCGTGLLEASFLCNKLSPTCRNVSKYVWWDSFHPTTKTYNILAQNFTAQITKILANNS